MSRAGETFVGRVGSPFLFGEDASHVTGGRNVRRASVLTIPLRRGRVACTGGRDVREANLKRLT